MSTERFAAAIADVEQLVKELEDAAAHARTAIRHYTGAEVPRACAHLWAAHGHLSLALRRMSAVAELHASKAVP